MTLHDHGSWLLLNVMGGPGLTTTSTMACPGLAPGVSAATAIRLGSPAAVRTTARPWQMGGCSYAVVAPAVHLDLAVGAQLPDDVAE